MYQFLSSSRELCCCSSEYRSEDGEGWCRADNVLVFESLEFEVLRERWWSQRFSVSTEFSRDLVERDVLEAIGVCLFHMALRAQGTAIMSVGSVGMEIDALEAWKYWSRTVVRELKKGSNSRSRLTAKIRSFRGGTGGMPSIFGIVWCGGLVMAKAIKVKERK